MQKQPLESRFLEDPGRIATDSERHLSAELGGFGKGSRTFAGVPAKGNGLTSVSLGSTVPSHMG